MAQKQNGLTFIGKLIGHYAPDLNMTAAHLIILSGDFAHSTVADPGEGPGGPEPPPYFFGNIAFSLKCRNISSQNSTFIINLLKAGPLLS